jgi:hypothetical protein
VDKEFDQVKPDILFSGRLCSQVKPDILFSCRLCSRLCNILWSEVIGNLCNRLCNRFMVLRF